MRTITAPKDWDTRPGIYRRLDEAHYHASRNAISKSWLDKLNKSPQHLRHYLDSEDDSRTDAMVIGSAVHIAILEPARMLEYVVMPEFKGKGSVAAREEWVEAHQDRTIIKQDHMTKVQDMASAILQNVQAVALLTGGENELTVSWRDTKDNRDRAAQSLGGDMSSMSPSDLLCKARIDCLQERLRLAIDLKTTADGSARGFAKSCANFRYNVQAAFYIDACRYHGKDVDHYAFVCVESAPPYAVSVYRLKDEAIDRGRQLYLQELDILSRCIERNEWPGYNDGQLTEIDLPGWAYQIGEAS